MGVYATSMSKTASVSGLVDYIKKHLGCKLVNLTHFKKHKLDPGRVAIKIMLISLERKTKYSFF